MATGTPISVEEYLQMTYRPDCDYVDGELVERNQGELSHGRLQTLIAVWLFQREARFRIKAITEVRLQINPRRFRIPDVMVLSLDAPHEEIVRTPPLLCIEILSKGDSLGFVWERIEEYLGIGVPVCWVIDPLRKRAWTATTGQLAEVKDGVLRAGEIAMPLADVLE